MCKTSFLLLFLFLFFLLFVCCLELGSTWGIKICLTTVQKKLCPFFFFSFTFSSFFFFFFFFGRFFLLFFLFVLFLIGGSRNSYAITQHPRHIKMKQEKNNCADIILRVMIFTVFEQLATSRKWQEELCASSTPPLSPPPQPHPPTTTYRPKAW